MLAETIKCAACTMYSCTLDELFSNYFSLYCTPIIIRCKLPPWQIGIYGMDITCDSAAWSDGTYYNSLVHNL